MRIEVRADNTVRIEGYVNVVERESRPVITPRGKVIERVESGVFRKALESETDIPMTIDHNRERVITRTGDGSLTLKEDAIGLKAETVTSDAEVVKAAREKLIKGWSFGMKNVIDSLEEREGKLPLRHIRGITLDHVTLVIHQNPCYSATSVEVRAEGEEEIEERSMPGEITMQVEAEKKKPDYTKLEERLKKLKGE